MAGTYIDFSFTPTAGSHALSVAFTPSVVTAATYAIAYCSWKFGDGNTSNETNPTHVYNVAGSYYPSATITVMNKSTGILTEETYVSTSPITVYEYGVSAGDLDGTVTDTSYQYAVDPANGTGFSKNTGASFPMGEAETSSLLVYDDDGQYHGLIWDYADGKCYEISMRDGPDGTDTVDYYEDKCSNDSEDGTAIAPLIKFVADQGEQPHYKIEHVGSHIYTEPSIKASGYITGTTFDTTLFKDGQQAHESTLSAKIEDTAVPNYEIISDRKLEGNSIAVQAVATQSRHCITGRQSYYIAKDIPNDPTTNATAENGYQLELASNLLCWVTRGDNLLYDKINKASMSGSYTAVTGPDGNSNSGFQISSSRDLLNSASSATTVLAWYKGTGRIDGAVMTAVSASGDWTLQYIEIADPTPAALTLLSGNWADVRVYTGTITAAAKTYLFNDTVYNAGRNTMPSF